MTDDDKQDGGAGQGGGGSVVQGGGQPRHAGLEWAKAGPGAEPA
jgi:hypothetical protein